MYCVSNEWGNWSPAHNLEVLIMSMKFNEETLTVEVDFSVTNENKEKVEGVRAIIDFKAMPLEELYKLATSNRIIQLQRVMRTLSVEELEEYVEKEYYVSAADCGKKIVSADEVKSNAKAMLANLTPEEREAFIQEMMQG